MGLRGTKFSVKWRLIFSFVLILIVPSIVIGAISFETAKTKVSTEYMQGSNQSVQLLNSTINQMIGDKEQEVDVFAQSITSNQYQGAESPLVREQLDRYQSQHTELLNTYVGTTTGLMIQSPKAELPKGYDPRTRPWYQLAMNNKGNDVVTVPYVDDATGNVVVTIAKVTNDGSGVVAIDLNLKDLLATVSQVKVGTTGYVYIIDQNKKYVVHSKNKPGSDAIGPQYDFMLSHDSGTYQYLLNGQPKELAFVTNKLTGWKLAGTMDEQDVTNQSQSILNTTIIVIGIALVLGAILIYIILLSITRPLRRLLQATENISQGDLTVRIETKSTDEFGKLSNSFNTMVESLRTVILGVSETASQLAASSEELTASAEQSAAAAEHTAITMQQLAEGTDKQVRSMEETDQTVKELNIGVQHIASSAQAVSSIAVQASEDALAGNQSIHKAIQQMKSISEEVNTSAKSIQSLGENAQQIGAIVETITGIASQTNLLALNAAIEAARAGEHGLGFSVVADEVRKLAEQSSNSAQQIAEYITSIQSEIQKSVDSMMKGTEEVALGIEVVNVAGASFKHIQSVVHEVTTQIQEVSAAVQQISAGAEQVSMSIDLITEVTETTAAGTQTVSASSQEQLASMEEITSSASALSEMAEQLEGMIRKFKLSKED